MTRGSILGLLVGVGTSVIVVAAQGQKPVLPMSIDKVKDNLFVITGADTGGNTAVYVADKGVVLVDTKYAGYGQAILDQVKKVTPKPVTHIINTHTHGDHVGANDFFPATVEIVTHEATAGYMAKMKDFAEPSKKHALPDRTFKDRMTVLSGNDAIDLYYFGPAHTGGDAFIVFRNLRVMHAGDVFARPGAPLMDANNGGTGIGFPGTVAKAIGGIKNVDTVIPGHSAVTTWQAFVDYGEFLKAFVSSAQASAKAGKSTADALKELVLPEKFKGYEMQRAAADIELIYKELKK
jgi:glyoxylase-like metal-dependent hydrolase (beta-lactamase superfamily II)